MCALLSLTAHIPTSELSNTALTIGVTCYTWGLGMDCMQEEGVGMVADAVQARGVEGWHDTVVGPGEDLLPREESTNK